MKCPRCGRFVSPAAMTRHGCCYECATGHKTELHHVWGGANSPVKVKIPGNVHRGLDELRAERCDELKYPGDDALRQLAAAIATIGDGANYLVDYARQNGWPEWVANIAAAFAKAAKSSAHWLLCLAAALNCHFGEDWAVALNMPSWRPPEGDE